MELTVQVSDMLFEKLTSYQKTTHKRTIEEVVTDLLFYALELSPRQRLLDALERTPDADVTLTEIEQLAMVDAVRQEVYEEQQQR
ncbi:MAG: hypothetical protein RBT80_10895 [Candidatus Vecturithrix sp.]|jgi:hypothetical protein|nr:hypothetical protein [Candidatus Vecturithrix sp.]